MSDTQQTYTWGDGCTSYVLLQTPHLSVKREIIPPGSTELMHLHREAQQLFYVLKGEGIFYADAAIHTLAEGESIHILPGTKHLVVNRTDTMLELLVVSQPDTSGDRINLE